MTMVNLDIFQKYNNIGGKIITKYYSPSTNNNEAIRLSAGNGHAEIVRVLLNDKII